MRIALRTLIIVTALSLFLPYSGFATTENSESLKQDSNISLTPTIGGYLFAGSDSLNPSALYGLKIGYDLIGTSILDTLGIEGTVNYFNTTTKSGSNKADGYLFRVDAIYSLTPRNKLVPFLAVGLGDILINKDSKGDNNPLLNYGIGLKYYLQEYLALRMDARQLFVYKDANTKSNFELSAGLTYLFGKEQKKLAPPADKPNPVEKPEVIENNQEESAPPAAARPEPSETTRAQQQAQAVPAQALAAKTANAVVPAPAPVAVPAPAESPKPSAQKLVRQVTVEFEFAKTDLKHSNDELLRSTAELIKAAPHATVSIEGHTDNIGSSAVNLTMSILRARSLKKSLVELGVDPKMITIKGYGFTMPTDKNTTAKGRQRNRRAVAVIVITLDQ